MIHIALLLLLDFDFKGVAVFFAGVEAVRVVWGGAPTVVAAEAALGEVDVKDDYSSVNNSTLIILIFQHTSLKPYFPKLPWKSFLSMWN